MYETLPSASIPMVEMKVFLSISISKHFLSNIIIEMIVLLFIVPGLIDNTINIKTNIHGEHVIYKLNHDKITTSKIILSLI